MKVLLFTLIGMAVASIAAAQGEPEPAVAAAAVDDLPLGHFRIRSFGAADGLRNLIVLGIAQDGDGMLWVATEDGVYRYDGQQFTHYSMQDGLPAIGVRVLGIAPDGAVCAGTRAGMACWNGSRFSPRGAEGVPRTWVRALAAGPGVLWAGTTEGLLVRRGNGAFEPAPGWPASPRSVKAIWADAEGVVVGDEATLRLSTGDGVWRRIGAEVGLGDERIEGVLRDRDGTLWIRSVHHLWTLPRGATRVVDLSDELPAGSDVSGNSCGMAISPWGDVLVGTERGIARRRAGRWQLLDGSLGIPMRVARTLLVDREGTVWIGSMGLFQWMGRGLISRHDMSTGLPDDVVWTIGRDPHNTLWLGTGKCMAKAIDGRWSCLPPSVGWTVRTFVSTPQGGIFAGGAPPDLLYVDPAGQATTLELQGERVSDRHIMAAALGPEGDLWLATSTGLYRLPGAQPGRPERVEIPGTKVDGSFVSVMVADGRLWTTSESGLAVLDHGVWRVLDRSAGFRASSMRHVIRRRDGRMCVSFSDVDGLTCFQWDGAHASQLVDISLADGLTSGRIYFLGEDRQQRLWIGTGDGVDVVTASGVDHFDQTDGLAGNDSTARAFFEDSDGSLWLGTSTGVSHVLAQHYRGPPMAPRTTVLSSALGGSPIPTGLVAPVQVPHDRNSVAASFAADTFIDPRRVEFQVRLSPLESEWSTTRLREARYAALPPGSYQLEMRARTGAGAWGAPAELRFAVLPAWWQTRWFIVLAGGLVLAGLGSAATWRHRVLWRRRARQLTQQSDARFRELIEAMPDLVSVHRDDQLIYLNQAARQMLGADAAREPRQVDLVDRIHPDDRPLAANLFSDARSPDAPPHSHAVELRLAASDGTWRHCELSGRRIDLGDGPVVVVTGRDVTERDRLRAKLLVSDRMASLGTLAAGIAHEINNPLAYVTANLEVVAEALTAEPPPSSPEQHAEHAKRAELLAAIDDAREGAERVRKIVRGLRSFSRSVEEKRQPIALPEVIAAAIRLTSNEVKHRAVLVLDIVPTPAVLADDGRLTQVFINLLINAAHAIPEGNTDANRITVRTRTAPDGRAIAEIEDTGAGMPPEILARAFDPFFTTKEVGEGTGLGLSICHGIINGLGGQITIDSTPGRGCLVRVMLPPAGVEAQPAPPPAPASTDAAPRRRRVLIVDDEPRVAQALERMLHADYDLTLVSCGATAIEHITAGVRYDAIITDVMMPNMTGVELFDRLEALAPDQASRVIFLTGGVFTPQTQARLETAGNPQLQKPVGAHELRACVAKLVAGPRRAERVGSPPRRGRIVNSS